MPRAPLYGLVWYSLLMFLFLYMAIKKMNLVLKDGYLTIRYGRLIIRGSSIVSIHS